MMEMWTKKEAIEYLGRSLIKWKTMLDNLFTCCRVIIQNKGSRKEFVIQSDSKIIKGFKEMWARQYLVAFVVVVFFVLFILVFEIKYLGRGEGR